MVRRLPFLACVLVLVVGCKEQSSPNRAAQSSSRGGPPAAGPGRVGPQPQGGQSLVEARKGFVSKLARRKEDKEPVDEPPVRVFQKVKYESPAGKLAAYLTPDPKDAKKHPAIIWITGGDCNSIGDVWTAQPAENDQTAAAYRKAGIVMMFPSLRGGNDNPGTKEGFLGEVDDILAAAEFLVKQSYVDPARVYLGGHSTGGTTVLLTAECSDRFRAVFSFGPVDDVGGYGPEYLPFDFRNPRELLVRSPGRWLNSIKSPVFVIEGTRNSNLDSLRKMARTCQNSNVHFVTVRGASHFSVLAPVNQVLAQKVVADNGPTSNLTLTEEDVTKSGNR